MSPHPSRDEEYLQSHRSHDYGAVLAAWKRLARRARARFEVITESGGYPVMGWQSGVWESGTRGLYLSAGVHGDEPAGVVALLEWAGDNIAWLKKNPVLIFPCFNPWGLVNNSRTDHRGVDLNRHFHRARDPHISGWVRFVRGLAFHNVLSLHEDYDAQGLYLYEIGARAGALGPGIFDACFCAIRPDPRKTIEGRRAKEGYIFRVRPPVIPEGLPEPLQLQRMGAVRSLTLETPSEFSLATRVRAQRLCIDFVKSATG